MEHESPYLLALVEREEVIFDIYFLNNSDLPVENLRLVSGGTMIRDDEVIKTTSHEEVIAHVPARGSALAGQTDVYELDDTFLGFTARFVAGGEEKAVPLGVPTYATIHGYYQKRLPILGVEGYLFSKG